MSRGTAAAPHPGMEILAHGADSRECCTHLQIHAGVTDRTECICNSIGTLSKEVDDLLGAHSGSDGASKLLPFCLLLDRELFLQRYSICYEYYNQIWVLRSALVSLVLLRGL